MTIIITIIFRKSLLNCHPYEYYKNHQNYYPHSISAIIFVISILQLSLLLLLLPMSIITVTVFIGRCQKHTYMHRNYCCTETKLPCLFHRKKLGLCTDEYNTKILLRYTTLIHYERPLALSIIVIAIGAIVVISAA